MGRGGFEGSSIRRIKGRGSFHVPLALLLLVGLLVAIPSTSQAAGTAEIGVPTLDANNRMTKLTYGDGTVATMTYTNIVASAPQSTVQAKMEVNPGETWWGGQGDVSTAFSPTSLAGG
jgi:hypothetical protein